MDSIDSQTQQADQTESDQKVVRPNRQPKKSPPNKNHVDSQLKISTQTVETTKCLTKVSNQSPSKPKSKPPVRQTIQKDRVIQYETVRDNDQHPDHSLIKTRKQNFGIHKSLDLIVKPDEKVQVGGAVAPIKQISERLHLNQGKIIEDTIDEPFQFPKQRNVAQMKQDNVPMNDHPTKKKDRHINEQQTKTAMKSSSIPKSLSIELNNPKNEASESNKQTTLIPGYPYIEESSLPARTLWKTLSKNQPNEKRYLPGDLSPETHLDIYPPQSPKPYETSTYLGIRVVQPGTNIWEIHFDLLKEYFQHKGITLSPHADEPKKSGESSGVGKILKFSEQLVNIYNLKSQTFENNLNVLQPLSVIVIYNMSEIFGVLDDIDYSVIERIEFDGESLLIPSAQ